jgi:hypothetical protein
LRGGAARIDFDDIQKPANKVIKDDFPADYKLTAEHKVYGPMGGKLACDLNHGNWKDSSLRDVAKVVAKLAEPLTIGLFSVDKLEVDSDGKFQGEVSTDQLHPDLKVEMKSDLDDVSVGCSYTGLEDVKIKLDTKATKPEDFTIEGTGTVGLVTYGAKAAGSDNLKKPDLGARVMKGPYFASLLIKEKFKAVTAHGCFKASDDLKLACTYDYGGAKDGSYSAALAYTVQEGTDLKVKAEQDKSVSCSLKQRLPKGLTVLGGLKVGKSADPTYGLRLSME